MATIARPMYRHYRRHGPRSFKPGPPTARDIQPINCLWTEDILIFQSSPPMAR